MSYLLNVMLERTKGYSDIVFDSCSPIVLKCSGPGNDDDMCRITSNNSFLARTRPKRITLDILYMYLQL